MPTAFMGKTWIFVVQAITFGIFAAFGLGLGPLFLLGIMVRADGRPGTDAGIAMCLMGIPLLLIFAMAVFNLRARREPLLRLCREGIEIVRVGSSSLDGIPMIPAVLRIAWLIVSTEGFRKTVVHVPWGDVLGARVTGPRMARRLVIVVSPARAEAEDDRLSGGAGPGGEITLDEFEFKTPLDQIAEAIHSAANAPVGFGQLPSWDEPAGLAGAMRDLG
ncbi:hypothetical protein AB1L88_26200 [Tautonia sp. JC769]|uniref:hypothetical protein n=1 Tax=Tautonia sp. JC769 TaxID=3232135 RepID=UPI003459A7E8